MDSVKHAQRMTSKMLRAKKKEELQRNLDEYHFINDIFQIYPPTSFKVTDFASEEDWPIRGDRRERNRITARNSREREKRRTKLLMERLEYLRPLLYQYDCLHIDTLLQCL